MDAGAPIAQSAVKQALETVVGRRRVSVFPTRNEQDCIGNLGVLLALGTDARLLFGGGGGILEWVNDPRADPLETANFLGRTPIVPASNDSTMTVSPHITLRFYNAAVKQMLLTQWAYDENTKTLFTSEFFSWNHQRDADAPPVVTTVDDLPDPTTVANEIECRVNWLRGARVPDLHDDLRAIFEKCDVEVIAPIHGCVLQGREVVAAHCELAHEALAQLLS